MYKVVYKDPLRRFVSAVTTNNFKRIYSHEKPVAQGFVFRSLKKAIEWRKKQCMNRYLYPIFKVGYTKARRVQRIAMWTFQYADWLYADFFVADTSLPSCKAPDSAYLAKDIILIGDPVE